MTRLRAQTNLNDSAILAGHGSIAHRTPALGVSRVLYRGTRSFAILGRKASSALRDSGELLTELNRILRCRRNRRRIYLRLRVPVQRSASDDGKQRPG